MHATPTPTKLFEPAASAGTVGGKKRERGWGGYRGQRAEEPAVGSCNKSNAESEQLANKQGSPAQVHV